MRFIKEDQVSAYLIFSKQTIPPNKELSIPLLELLAVLLGARSLKFVEKSLQLKINDLVDRFQICIALTIIKKDATPFVQRRVDEIKSTGNIDFRYVAPHNNPGDIAQARISTNELQECKLWWNGPNWLRQGKDHLPVWNVNEV